MSDRELSVKINLGVGTNTAASALNEQRRAAEELTKHLGRVAELQERIRQLAAMQPGANTPVGRRLAGLREQLEQMPGYGPSAGRMGPSGPSATIGLQPSAAVAAGPAVPLNGLSRARQLARMRAGVPEGAARDEWQATFDAMVEQEQLDRDEARKRSLANLARARLSGEIPAEEIASLGGAGAGGNPLLSWMVSQRLGMALPGAAHSAVAFGGPTRGNPLAGFGPAGDVLSSTLGVMSGPIGATANVLGALGKTISILGEATKTVTPSVEELSQRMREAQGLFESTRRSGLPTAENLRAAFQGTFTMRGFAEQANHPAENRVARFRNANQLARQAVQQLQGLDLGTGRAELEELFTQMRNAARTGELPEAAPGAAVEGGAPARARRQRREQLFGQYQVNFDQLPAEIRDFLGSQPTARGTTDAQIRQMAEVITTGRLARAQSQAEITGAILRGGVLPNLRPGAPGIDQLPSLFQSRQSDVLSMHDQIQMDSIRDQRAEIRFQTEVRLYTEIRDSIRNLRFAPIIN
jgi:hypothetical protein